MNEDEQNKEIENYISYRLNIFVDNLIWLFGTEVTIRMLKEKVNELEQDKPPQGVINVQK